MKSKRAVEIAKEFKDSKGYTVSASLGALIIKEEAGRTSCFVDENNFWNFIPSISERLFKNIG